MPVDEEYLQRLENPTSEGLNNLLDKSLSDVSGKFRSNNINVDEETLQKSTYTFYHNWEEEQPKFGFFLQNPGTLKARHEGQDLLDASEPLEYIDVYQRYAAEWFVDKNNHFAGRFFPLLAEYDLISINDWRKYVENGFFEDFYMTDLVKYRVATGDINPNHLEKSYDLQLRDELEEVGLDLVFAFSSRMWKTLYSEMEISAVSDGVPKSNSVSECHGYLYKVGEPLDSFIIPLAHYSRRVWGQYLRDSYFDYLKEGLKEYKNCN